MMTKTPLITTENKMKEAVDRMKTLGVFKETIRQFQEGKVSRSEPPFGAYYWVEGEEIERIRDFEQQYNALVYTVIRSNTTLGTMDAYLYVSDYSEEWKYDRENIRSGVVFAYVENLDAPDCSEFGTIGVERTPAAGLKRIW